MASTADIRAGRAFVEITTRDGDLTKGLNNARRKLADFSASAQRAGLVFVGVGAAAATAFIPAVRAAADAEESLNRFNAVFGDQAGEAGQFVDELADTVNRSRFEIRDAIASFQAFFVGLGFGGEQAQKLSQDVQKAALDLASFNNLADTEATDRLRAALSGSSEVLDQFGVNIRQAAIDQELLRQGIGKTAQEATEQEKVIARLAIITRALTQQGAVGDAARTAGSFTNQLKGARAALTDLQVEIGSKLLPVLTPLLEQSTAILRATGEFAQQNGELITSVAKLAAGSTALGGSLLTVSVGARAAQIAIGLVSGPAAAAAALFGGLTAAAVGITAELNNGEVAGVAYSESLRQVGAGIGILSDTSDRLAAANRDVADAAREAAAAQDDLANAGSTVDQVDAAERLAAALRRQIAIRKEVLRLEAESQADAFEAEQTTNLRAEAGIRADPILSTLLDRFAQTQEVLKQGLTRALNEAFEDTVGLQERLVTADSGPLREQLIIREQLAAALRSEIALLERANELASTPDQQRARQAALDSLKAQLEGQEFQLTIQTTAQTKLLREDIAQAVRAIGEVRLPEELAGQLANLDSQLNKLDAGGLEDGFAGVLDLAGRVRREVERFGQKMAEIDRGIRQLLTGRDEPIGGRIQRDAEALKDQLRQANALTPEKEREIDAAASGRVVEERRQVEVRFREFGGDALASQIDTIRRQAEELKDELESLDALDPEIALRIDADAERRIRDLRDQLEAQAQAFTGQDTSATAVNRIQGEADSLKRELQNEGLLTAQLLRQIEEATARKIADAREASSRALQGEIARLEIQATQRGIAQRLALIELERREALRRARETGESEDDINRRAELQRQLALQEATPGPRGLFNARAAQSLAVGGGRTNEQLARRSLSQLEKLVQLNREQLQLIARGSVSLF